MLLHGKRASILRATAFDVAAVASLGGQHVACVCDDTLLPHL
jgi:hypothetical protein